VCHAGVSGVHLRGGAFFDDEVIGVLEVTVRAVFLFTYLKFTNGGASAAG
jgi:hypothetical protein